MPLDAEEAEAIVRANPGWNLPDKAQVDEIWTAAQIKLDPKPIKWHRLNTTLPVFIRHHETIERQLDDERFGNTDGLLIAGHKKDIVRGRQAGRVAIYGWHYRSGQPIQPLSNVHGASYKDYSHGVRLVRPVD